jgi:hypothetical protein
VAEVSIITFSLRDDAGKRSSVPVYVPATGTEAQVSALADVLAEAIDNVTGAVIESISISMAHTLPAGLKAVTVADSLNGMGGLFSFDAADTPYSYSVFVPAIRPSLVTLGVIDPADTDVAAFVTAMHSGTADLDPSDRYANDLLLLHGVEVRFRKS